MKVNFILISLICVFGLGLTTLAQEVKINTNLAIEADGTVRMDGAATVFDDLKVPFTSATKGANNLVPFDETNIGLLFPDNTSAAIYMVVQLPHTYKEGTNIYPHIHWQQSNATLPTWNMAYKWFNNNEFIPDVFSPLSTSSVVFEGWTTGNLAQISSFAPITGTGKKISSILLVKLWRTGGPAGNILAFEFDIHYEVNTMGSREEFYKENQ